MPKRKIPSDTKTFQYVNVNPYGRITGDCVYRALSYALDIPWKKIMMELAESSVENGYAPNCKENYSQYLAKLGYVKQKQPRKSDNTKLTGQEFCKNHPHGTFVCHIGGHHITVISEGKVIDSWNCSGRCVGNYWIIK